MSKHGELAIIPESSIQDKFLLSLTLVALLVLAYFLAEWSYSAGTVEEQQAGRAAQQE